MSHKPHIIPFYGLQKICTYCKQACNKFMELSITKNMAFNTTKNMALRTTTKEKKSFNKQKPLEPSSP
jgi:hypothetical protein